VGLDRGVEVADVRPRLRSGGPRLRIRRQHLVHRTGEIEDDRLVDGLARERRAAPAGQHRNPLFVAVLVDRRHVRRRLRHHDADRCDLVRRGVGRVQPLRVLVEPHVAIDPVFQRVDEARALYRAASVIEVPPVPRIRIRRVGRHANPSRSDREKPLPVVES